MLNNNMANEDIKQELEKLKREQVHAEEREKLAMELRELRSKKWEREHPRLARWRNFFLGGGILSRRQNTNSVPKNSFRI